MLLSTAQRRSYRKCGYYPVLRVKKQLLHIPKDQHGPLIVNRWKRVNELVHDIEVWKLIGDQLGSVS